MFIVPKNSGLEKARDLAREFSGEKIEVRGEDVPWFTADLIKKNKNVIGITGEDLFKEFLLETRNLDLIINKRVEWKDDSFLFKKPTLCLLGPKERSLESFPKKLKICINRKYKEMAKKFCTNLLETKGYNIEKIYASGVTEEFFSKGLVDLVIDIVCSGKSAEEYGLEVYDKLFESDMVIIGGKKPNINNENFQLVDLYKKIKERIDNPNLNSSTNKLVNNPNFLRRKIIEEAAEVITEQGDKQRLVEEFADLFYNLLVYMAINKITIGDVDQENLRRDKETLINPQNLTQLEKEEVKNQ